MRNSTSGSTPKTNTVQDDSVSTNNNAEKEKTSAKKLKQARLPFKVIAPGTSPVGTKTTATPLATAGDKDKEKDAIKDSHSTDSRKRKLSYDDTDDDVSGGGAIVIDADDNVSKENVEILKAATKKKKTNNNDHPTSEVVVSLLDDDEDDEDVEGEANKGDVKNTSVISAVSRKDLAAKTPKATPKDKRNGAGTPQTSNAQKDKNGSASKLQIKLPLSAGKKKRRKSKLHQLSSLNSSTTAEGGSHNHSAQELSSDDIEEIAVEQNPQKRKKLNSEYDDVDDEDDKTKRAKSKSDEQEQEVEVIALDSEPEEKKEEEEEKRKTTQTRATTKAATSAKENLKKESSKKPSEQSIKNWTVSKTTSKEKESKQELKTTSTSEKTSPQTKNKSSEKSSEDDEEEINTISSSSDEEKTESNENDKEEELDESVLSDNDNEADDERDNLNGKSANISSDMSENSKTNLNSTLETLKDGNSTKSTSKNLTPKQAKLMDQRRKAREEKERKLQEEKQKKQQEKEEKELAKKREREEKEEQRRKEREEKEEQKRKERDEKERKRLAELEVKNEEKRKKNEAKEEELRKKEEERKRKEQEKEEAELKKKKAAQAFTKFFVAKTPNQAQLKNEEDSNTGDDNKVLAFRPFQVKGDMKLAPVIRKIFTPEEKNRLDALVGFRNEDDEEEDVVRRKPLPKNQLYLNELRSGKILPGKWRRPSTESKDDVILVEDELERVGQEIVEDTPAYIREEMRVKFYKFHDNRRPPYYGTWRKKSAVVRPRKPFAQDKKFFDYEVDSDDEWEEEEPGESLEDGSDDDKEKESEDDDYEVDNEWFVPHGHLSDEELQNEDEFGMGDDNTREAQKAKLQILQQEFAQEMKKKTEKIKPRLIGCIWTDINGNQPAECARILWDTLEKKAMLFTEPPLIEEPEGDRSAEPSSSPSGATNAEKPTADKLKPISLSDNMIKDLIRLLHGNNHSKNFLINEFIAYIEKTEDSVKNGDLRKPLKSVVRDKIDDMAEWQAIDATASTMQDVEQANDDAAAVTDSTKKKKKGKRRLCWVVKQETLNKMDLSTLELQNSWEYTLPPKFVKSDKEVKTDETESTSNTPVVAEDSAKGKNTAATSQITKFTKVLTAEEKASKLQNSPSTSTNTTSIGGKTAGTETKSNTPTTSKEKKRVPLLMSVARGQQIPTPAKNKLISQFLQQKSKDPSSSPTTSTSRSKTVISPQVEDDDVVILD